MLGRGVLFSIPLFPTPNQERKLFKIPPIFPSPFPSPPPPTLSKITLTKQGLSDFHDGF